MNSTQRATHTNHASDHRSWIHYLRLLLIALIAALILKESVIEAYRIPSESMEKTLLVGDYLLADRLIYGARIPLTNIRLPALREPIPGDVVVFKRPDDPRTNYIKRVIAVGGDSVKIVNKQVYINGRRLDDSKFAIHVDSIVVPAAAGQPRDNFGPILIPVGEFFVLGDNRDNSTDSRYWGCIPREMIIGQAFLIHWSWQATENREKNEDSNALSFVRSMAYYISSLPDHVRWQRLFRFVR